MKESYEVEIKCLLGNKENADALKTKMQATGDLQRTGENRQLNHYFEGKGDFAAVAKLIDDPAERATFIDLTSRAKDTSLRTRDADGKVILVLKVSIDDTTSANGTARREFEKTMNMSLDALDQALLAAGFAYQAKWSRERSEYLFKGVNITIDKNAGYGYLAEFESIVDDTSLAEEAKSKIRALMKELGVEELDQARLARMFAYYNQNWRDYYGTEKVFSIQ